MTNSTIPAKPQDAIFNDGQWQAIHQTGSNLLVSASAGSGKTMVLTQRIVNHLAKTGQNTIDIDELLVVTFTELAASEMKEKLESNLKKAINQTDSPELKKRYLDQLQKLAQADIRTLHSFCMEVIQQFFYLIDFNPNFTMMTDEVQLNLIYEEIWHKLTVDISQDKYQNQAFTRDDLYDLLARYGSSRDDEGLFKMVLNLYNYANSNPNPNAWLKATVEGLEDFENFSNSPLYQEGLKPYLVQSGQLAVNSLNSAMKILAVCSGEIIDRYQEVLDTELKQAERVLDIVQTASLEEIINSTRQVSFSKWPSNSKKYDDYENIIEMKSLRDQAKLDIESIGKIFLYDYDECLIIEEAVAKVVRKIVDLTLIFSQALREYKKDQNIITYNDLEHLTLEILAPLDEKTNKRQPSLAAKYYQKKFKEVLVDEYQDINELQDEILAWLSHEYVSDKPGNLFMVGDVKQSIYKFRMAEPSLFMDKYNRYGKGEGGELIILDENYRSRIEVLQFTNFIFEQIMGEDFGEIHYGDQEALVTGRLDFKPDSPSEDFNIDFLIYARDELDDYESDNFRESIDAEAHIVAQDILTKIKTGYQIYDKDSQEMRPVEFKDFVILTSTRSPFLNVQQVFDQYQIPLESQKIENYFQRQEIQLMVAWLKLIDNPLQDIPLVAILRSYFVGLSDEELSWIRIEQKDNLFYYGVVNYINSYLNSTDPAQADLAGRLNNFMDQLFDFRSYSQDHSLVELIWYIYEKTYFLDYVAGLTNGSQRVANLHALYERAESFSQTNYSGVSGFVTYIEQSMRQDKDLAEPVLLKDQDNNVRIMTVHSSKGLEFPVVYLMNTQRNFYMSDVTHGPYTLSKKYGIGADLYDYERGLRFSSLTRESIKIIETNQAKAEEMRKLYVALTRCEQKLIIVGQVSTIDSWQKQIDEVKSMSDSNDLLISTAVRQKANNWLSWLNMALARRLNHPNTTASNFSPKQINVNFITDDEIDSLIPESNPTKRENAAQAWLKGQKSLLSDKQLDPDFQDQVKSIIDYDYPEKLATQTAGYQSVSELKRLYEEPRIEKLNYYTDRSLLNYDEPTTNKEGGIRFTGESFRQPAFIQDEKLEASQIGTILHYYMQCLDFSKLKNLAGENLNQELKKQLDYLVSNGQFTTEEALTIKLESVGKFVESDLGQLLVENSAKIQRERAFSYLLPARNIFSNLEERDLKQLENDQLLVHGVVDLYLEVDGQLILLDYKTDRYKKHHSSKKSQIETIIDRYRFQMSLYKQALSVAEGLQVKDVYLVLLDFEENVKVDNLIQF